MGRALCSHLNSQKYAVCPTSRAKPLSKSGLEYIITGSVDEHTDWSTWLLGVDVVIHLAARAHILKDRSSDPLSDFRSANTLPTLKLGHDAVAAKVKRFIFVSSIGVNGAETFGKPYRSGDIASPHSAYALSKYEAEVGLTKLLRDTATDLVILRPPLIYGTDAPGNIELLKKMIDKNYPIPLGDLSNKRSFISIVNFLDLLEICINHDKVANKTLLVSDDSDLSTSEFMMLIAALSDKDISLVKVYPSIVTLFLSALGKRKVAQSLFGDLQVDIRETIDLLDWKPVFDPQSLLRNA